MAKKIIEAPTTLSRSELDILARVPNDVFLFSSFCFVIHKIPPCLAADYPHYSK